MSAPININMLLTKDISNKFFDYIYPWGETLAYIAWKIRASYCHTIQATPGKYLFFRDMIFNLASFIDWKVINTGKQRQAEIDNVR